MAGWNTKKRLFFVLIVVICLGALLVPLLSRTIEAAADAQEMALNPDGWVHELSRDADGNLWASDFLENQVWRINPADGKYTIYNDVIGATDAKIDSAGDLWWSDLEGGTIGRYTPGASKGTIWQLGDGFPLGITIDEGNRVWIADSFEPFLYSFVGSTKQLCMYDMPDEAASDYLIYQNNAIWLGDTSLGRIIRFNTTNNTYSIWQLPEDSFPQGLTIDDDGRLWYADAGLGELGRINADNNQLRRYVIPAKEDEFPEPIMLSFESGLVWYTDLVGSVGSLNPATASGKTSTIAPSTTSVSPSCSSAGNGENVDISKKNGTINWKNTTYPLIHDKNGWMIYDLPEGAAPWGIIAHGASVWFNDQGDPGTRAQFLSWMKFGEDPPPTNTVEPSPTATDGPSPTPTATATEGPSPTPTSTPEFWNNLPAIFSSE